MAFCINCGKELADGTKFCPNCGKKITEQPQNVENSVKTQIEKVNIESKKNEPSVVQTIYNKQKTSSTPKTSIGSKAKTKFREFWNKLSIFGKVSTISIAVSSFLGIIAFLASRVFAGIIAIVWLAVVIAALLMKKNVIKIPKAWIAYVLIILSFVLIVPYFSLFKIDIADYKKYDWNEIVLADILSVPESPYGEIISNSETYLALYVKQSEKEQYNRYIEACKEKGFVIDSELTGSSFYAFNGDGYKISLSFYSTSNEIHISLSAAMELGTFSWSNSYLAQMLPVPESTIGKIQQDNEDCFSAYVGNTSIDVYANYVIKCEDKGFTINLYKTDKHFSVQNEDGYKLTVDYQGNNVIHIYLSKCVSQTQKNGFDSTSNKVYTLAGYTVEIPKYWKSEKKIDGGFQRYAETNGKVAMLQVSAQAETDDNYPVTFDGLMDDNDNMIAAIESTAFEKVANYEVVDTGIVKGILYKGTIVDKDNGLTGYAEWFTFASEKDRTWCTLIFSQTNNTKYSYTDDFMKIIKSIKPVENTTPENTPAPSTTTEIVLTLGKDDFKDMNYQEAEKKFREMGFVNFKYKTVDTKNESSADTICYIEITEWFFGKSNFAKGDKFDADSTITFYTYKYTAPSPVSYSTNDLETAKQGNTGVFSYKSRGGSYDIYWIIDFDEGYVYYFTDGNGDTTCDRIAIVSGTLNDAVTITYHDGSSTWSYRLFFKWQNKPDHLVMQDNNGFTYDYYSTNLSSALSKKNSKTIYDY